MELKLHDYQVEAKEFLKTRPYAALFMDMGMGKTLTTLCSLMEIAPRGNILVIAPKTIAKATWQDEIDDFKIPVRTCSLVVNEKGRDLSRKKRLERYAEITETPAAMYFIGRDLVTDLVKYLKEQKIPWPFPTVVIDEMQSFKSPSSQRFKALKSVRKHITRLIGLSGTPAPNGLLDLWSELYLLDMGERLFPTITAYRDTYFNVSMIQNGYPVQWTPKPVVEQSDFGTWRYYTRGIPHNAPITQEEMNAYNAYARMEHTPEDEIYMRIGSVCLSSKNTSVKMPELIMEDVKVSMDDKERKLYDQLKKEKVIEVDGKENMAVNAGVLMAKLMQMASGTLYTDDNTGAKNREYCNIHEKKLDVAEYIVENTNSPVLIAYWFKSDLERLLKRIPSAVAFDGSPQMQKSWNAGEIPVMLLHPASAGHGINIQKGTGHTLVWFTLPWSLEYYKQTNARLYRQGQQSDSVTIYRIITKDTVETAVVNALNNKDITQTDIINAVMAETA